MGGETKSTVVKIKPISQDGSSSSKPRSDSSSLFRKKNSDQTPTKRPLESKTKFTTTVTKTEVYVSLIWFVQLKVKASSSSSKSTKKTTTVKKREKKVYSLPGQKFDVPEEREPLRIFYESLSKQIPSSEMAQFWLMEHGMLSSEKAKKAYERKQTRQKQLRMGTPVKSQPPSRNKPESSIKQQQVSKNGDLKAKKRIINDSDDDDDFILSPKRRKG